MLLVWIMHWLIINVKLIIKIASLLQNPSSLFCSSASFSHFHFPLNSFSCHFIPSFSPFPPSSPFHTSFASLIPSSPVPILALPFHKFSVTRAPSLSLFPYSFFFVSPRSLPFFPFPFPFALPLQRTHHGIRDNSTLMYSPFTPHSRQIRRSEPQPSLLYSSLHGLCTHLTHTVSEYHRNGLFVTWVVYSIIN